ncbi:MAG: ABC transporter substrate-binding protein [Bauldia sp.]|nr:ABC transporter substrate-binding protein [Bauldia sp.]
MAKGSASRIAGVFGAALLVLAPAAPVSAQAPPARVVSIALCADQMLIALADPGQIASLSYRATDPTMSFYAAEAEAYPHAARSAESVIRLRPDLVLVDSATPAATRDLLLRLGFRLADVDPVATIDEAITQIEALSDLLGRQERGAALAQLVASARFQAYDANWGLTAAYVRRRGFVAGEAELVSDILRVIGLNNAGDALVGREGGYLTLEQLVAMPPDFLIVPDTNPTIVDQGVAFLEHPALLELFPPERRIELPERLTSCGGPSLPEAIRLLGSEFRRVRP